MKKKTLDLLGIIINACTALFSLAGILWYYISQLCIKMEVEPEVLNFYFTVNSNIFLVICSIIALVFYVLAYLKDKDIPYWVSIMKLTAVTAVSLTFFTTVFFLTPVFGSQDINLMISFYTKASFFMHVLSPITAMVGFALFEIHNVIKFKHIWIAIVPIIIYETIYMSFVFATGNLHYDLYGFAHSYEGDTLHVGRAIVSIIATPIISFGLATLWWYLNKLSRKRFIK
ncbi:MAG: hypothetical protein K6E11_02020 [Bacilli bacterium]|nr:hypothetical protein [Bacilli bacterium]